MRCLPTCGLSLLGRPALGPLQESELTPTGSNLLDGRYAVLGYITDHAEILKEMQVGDKIEYAKVVDGLENLVQPK